MRRRAGVALVLALLLLAAAAADAGDRVGPLAAGADAPDIRLADQHGRPFALAATLEQRAFVVLAFYPRAFTSG